MTYTLPFKAGERLIELGGGQNARVRPNVDARPGPGVDLVANLSEPLPINDAQFDGVLSIYNLEHMPRRKVRVTISEMARILKPGGLAVVITANLKAQAAMIAAKDVWTDDDICQIFGDQNYAGAEWDFNAHHCGFSPEYAVRLFRECGFYEVRTMPLPECATDLIIEARKSAAEVLQGMP